MILKTHTKQGINTESVSNAAGSFCTHTHRDVGNCFVLFNAFSGSYLKFYCLSSLNVKKKNYWY